MKGWDINKIKKLQNKGMKVSGVDVDKELASKKERDKPEGVKFIEKVISEMGLAVIPEYRFMAPERQFRLDYYLEDFNIGIEYEGVFVSGDDKSRHSEPLGYTEDCVKYNHAMMRGIRVLRYTAKNYRDFEDHVIELISG